MDVEVGWPEASGGIDTVVDNEFSQQPVPAAARRYSVRRDGGPAGHAIYGSAYVKSAFPAAIEMNCLPLTA
jgi:hypothetical protein